MTAEDQQTNGTIRTRQNIVHEIGFWQGNLGRENVLILRQNNAELFSNISGIVYEFFRENDIKSTFERIRKEVENAYEEVSDEEDED